MASCRWKSKQLLKMTGVLSQADMMTHYKAQLLSKIEYKTAAVYHATDTVLAPLDRVQTRFLEAIWLDDKHALLYWN